MSIEASLRLQDRVLDMLGEGGAISERLPNYEFRLQQLDMAKGICKSIETGKHLIVEAGTGIGKSLAYLIPFVIYSAENNLKVVISTHTKTLQNQLYLKDLPFLREALKIKFNYALCLGSENFLCLRRLNSEYTYELFDSDTQLKDIKRIVDWSSRTESGLISDLDFIPKDEIRSSVCRDPDLCMGRRCAYKKDCFYNKAKKREKKSDILITNHSLFFTNLATGGQVLPNFNAVVFDEAQTLENVATNYLGFEISNTKIKYLFDRIYNPKTRRGILNKFRGLDTEAIIDIETNLAESRDACDKFFHEIKEIFGEESDSKRIRTKNIVFNYPEEPLRRLAISLSELLDYVEDEEDEILIKAHLKRCTAVILALSFILNHEKEDHVYWIEIAKRRRGVRYSLFATPIEISEELNRQLFNKIKPIVLTSATLSTNGNFEFIKGRLGIEDTDQLILGSPFNYEENVLLYLPKEIEDPNENFVEFQRHVLEYVKKIIDILKGRIFVLFTSYKMLNAIFDDLALGYRDMNLLRQGDRPRYMLLENFKRHENSVLLGTTTFWQGVDVPGKSLECVIITRLPFSVPDDPITEARMELIESRGGNPFIEYQVPQATMMFKQGFGRLIRTKTDRGVVAILDPRIRTRYYGRTFISALSKCRHSFDIAEVHNFFNYD